MPYLVCDILQDVLYHLDENIHNTKYLEVPGVSMPGWLLPWGREEEEENKEKEKKKPKSLQVEVLVRDSSSSQRGWVRLK